MKHITKRTLALLMSLMLMVSLFVGVAVPAQAAGNVTYKYSGSYVYNWGTRDTVATFLSPMAEAFYEDNGVTYDQLASYAGSSSTSSVPSSALYKQLQNLMKNNHDYETSYDATRDLFRYTDCQNNGNPSSISAFYSASAVGPSWDSGKTWNREHTWPNSKGDQAGNGENDIMMLRPETSSNNSSRGNKAYGESGGSSYYDPNGLGQKVRGDAARIMLYTYVRWGATNNMWGASGVMESKAVLLKWMQEDPVDTWELARNDAVESITGTRNVFVDYPELAFELFESTMPTNWSTPSGEAADGNQGNVDQPDIPTPDVPTTEDGVVENPTTGVAYKLGLNNGSAVYYATGAMSGYYGATETSVDAAADFYLEAANGGYYLYTTAGGNKQYVNLVLSGTYYNYTYGATASSVFTLDTEKNALCTTVGTEKCYIGTYGTYVTMGVLRTSKLQATDYIARLYGSEGGTTPDTPDTPVEVPTPDTELTIPAANALGSAMAADTYTEGKYYISGTIRNVESSTYGNMTIVDAAGNSFYIYGTYNADGTAIYGQMENKPVAGDTVTVYGPIGNHNGAPQSKNAWITSVTPGSGSGSDQPTGGVSISLMDVANRVSGSAAQQVWQQNGITVTNDKGSSTSDINLDYYNPVRFYKNSDLTIAYGGMTRIVINSSVTTGQYAKNYATPFADSNTDANATVSVDGDVVTIVFTKPVDSYKVTLTAGQARAFTITVYGEGGSTGGDTPDTPDQPIDPPVDPDVPVNPPVNPDVPATSVVIDFTNGAERTTYTSDKQVWEQNGIVVTNNKNASGQAVGDYGGSGYPVRFYQGSNLNITYPGMTKLVFTCNDYKDTYPTALEASISTGTVTVDGVVVTVDLPAAVDSFDIAQFTAQVRVNSITIYTVGGSAGGDTPDTPDQPIDPPVDPDVPGDDPVTPPSVSSVTYTFADYAESAAVTDYTKALDNYLTVGLFGTNTAGSGYFAKELRIYKACNAILTFAHEVSKIEINAGYKDGNLTVYVSDDGSTWTQVQTAAYTTAYSDIAINLSNPSKYVKLEAADNQVRIKTLTATFEGGSAGGDTPDTPDQPDTPDTPDVPTNDPTPDTELTIPAANELGLSKENNAYTEGKYYVSGTVLAIDNSKGYGNMYIGDDAGNQFYIYGTYSADGALKYGEMAENERPVVGDTVKVYGIIGTYNGTEAQMKNGWIISFTAGEGPANTDPTPDTELTIPEAVALGQTKLHNIYTEGKYYVIGKITSIVKEDYGNMYIEDEQGNSLYIYGLYSADGSIRYDGMEIKPVVGDTITVYGIIGNYNDVSQMKNAWLMSIAGGDTPDNPDQPCNHVYDNDCDADCNVCGETRTVGDHVWNNGSCTVCGKDAPSAAVIMKQSATAAYAKMGAKVSVSITADGDGLTYTWYIKNDGGSKYSKSSVTSATYSTTMSSSSKGRRAYCIVTDRYGNSVQSKTFMLREAASITKEPATAAYAKKGAKVSVKITASGDGLKYAWYLKNDGKSTYSKSSITSATYSATMSSTVKGRKVYCVVTDKYGKKVQSKTFLLREAASITKEPATAAYAKNGAKASVKITASGDGLKYTWYVKDAGKTKYTKSSITKSTYSVKMSSKVNGRRIYCVVTDKYGKKVQSKTFILKKK